ncbi:hypothetical protein BDN72DRAFT_759185 [Pluteus cervinus]|uniref:Uncharacterized protein n=1 Tax=Pluteus cervinus TaxID=181527 RepID=A0ACD3B8X0_9AGAR|nr:hypothetical protein BDN72DRAFT_759185 [Pluteus cervinus]
MRRSTHKIGVLTLPILLAVLSFVLSAFFLARNFVSNDAVNISTSHQSFIDTDVAAPTLARPDHSPHILLVTAFFPLSKSKHPLRDYNRWISFYLQTITTDIYLFTTPDYEPVLRQARGDLPITFNTSYGSPWDIPPLRDLQSKYQEMWNWDREKRRHSPELYAIWNGKPFFLDEGAKNAVTVSGRTYDYAFWNDAGSFRNGDIYQGWPDGLRVQQVFQQAAKATNSNLGTENLFFIPISSLPSPLARSWNESLGPLDEEISQGSFFGGSPTAVSWWRNVYYAYHDHWLSRPFFVGKDQTIINGLLLLFPSRFMTYIYYGEGVGQGKCASSWFYYQFWLSSSESMDRLRRVWNGKWSWQWYWDWKHGYVSWSFPSCRIARTRTMMELLKRAFGDGWEHPKSSFVQEGRA